MTLPASGPLVLGLTGGGNSINGEFGLGNSLSNYRGVFFGRGGQEFQFPVAPNLIAMGLFYSAYKITPQSPYYLSSGPFTVPVYNTMTLVVQGGTGGQAGYDGTNTCGAPAGNNGAPGSPGALSSFGGYVVGNGGAGGGSNGAGGQPGGITTITFTNPVQGGSGPPSGTTLTASIGGGGAGGQGGQNTFLYYGVCISLTRASNGSAGGPGSILISWT